MTAARVNQAPRRIAKTVLWYVVLILISMVTIFPFL